MPAVAAWIRNMMGGGTALSWRASQKHNGNGPVQPFHSPGVRRRNTMARALGAV